MSPFLHLKLGLALIMNLAFAGGWSGNGGISSKDVNNPWFLGEEMDSQRPTVSYIGKKYRRCLHPPLRRG